MSFLDLAKKRYSVRKYQSIPVEKEKLLQILEAGRMAPSAVNYQPLFFVVVQDEELRNKINNVYRREWFSEAPVVIVVCGDHSQSWKRGDGKDHCDIDAAIAIDHMSLAAADMGLGTCWVCAFDADQCHKLLDLPNDIEVVALLPLGYPREVENVLPQNKKRKPLIEMVRWNGFKDHQI